MLRIVHTRGRMAPAVEHFATSRLRIGCAPGSELLFAPREGRDLMPQHAEIREEGAAFYLVDLGTPSGTYVGGARVARHALRSGDVIALGSPDGPEFRVDILADRDTGAMPVQGPDADGRVDLDTAQRIVSGAVLRETAGGGDPQTPGPAGGDNDKARAIVATKVLAAQRRAARHNQLLTLGLTITFAATVITALAILRSHQAASQLGSEIGIDRRPGRKVGDVPTRVYTGRQVYDENRTALYVIGFLVGNKVGACCSAFAIKPNVLATNAHCVLAQREKGGTPVVTQNDSGGKVRFRVLASQIHPGYKSGHASADSPDVGLLRIDGRMPRTVTLASDAEIRALGPGDDIFVLGFPGRVMDPISPSATFLQGHVGRLLGMGELAPASQADAVLIQHDAVTRGGNSGSPIFNQYGHVIGVHAAHLDDEDEVQVNGRKTTVVDSSPFRIGMRIDLLNGVRSP